MGVARRVGRVGTFAVALGLGGAVVSGYGIAAADTDTGGTSAAGSTSSSATSGSSGTPSAAKPSTGPKRKSKAKAKAKGSSTPSADGPGAAQDVTDHTPPKISATKEKARTASSKPTSRKLASVDRSIRRADRPTRPTADPATESAEQITAPALHVVADPVDPPPTTPATPVDTPAEWVAAAVTRRELSAAPITISPQVTLTDAVITGSVNATNTTDNKITYSVAGKPGAGGKVTLNPKTGTFTFLPDEAVVGDRGTETFTVRISETTAAMAALQQVPVLGVLVEPVVVVLRRVPVVNEALRPLIGTSIVVPVAVDIDQVVPEDTPIAFATMVTSFDGTRISTNFFPALGLTQDHNAPTILSGAGIGAAGDTNPNSQWGGPYIGIEQLRVAGYNVVTWDPRGEHASGGLLQLDSPDYEARDVSAIISWLGQRPEAQLDGLDDPRIGMVGASYGGGIQLITAATDHRVDAIVPTMSWHSLNDSLYKDSAFRTGYATLLVLGMVLSGSNVNPEIYAGVLSGSLLGYLGAEHQKILANNGPGDELINQITAPTLLLQGTADTLFTLQEAMANARLLDDNGVPVKMVWFCGGHGTCLTHPDESVPIDAMMTWLDRYLKRDETVDTGPQFEWVDQNGQYYSSELLPTDAEFHGTSVVATGDGGLLPIIPLLGGSGPSTHTAPPFSIADADTAVIALDMSVKPGVATQILGLPEITLTYSGLGTARHIYAQLIDDDTGLVIGNLITPIPVTLDGREHTVTVPLEAIVQTISETDSLTLQLVGSTTAYLNLTSFGAINVSSLSLSFPTVAAGVAAREDELQSVA